MTYRQLEGEEVHSGLSRLFYKTRQSLLLQSIPINSSLTQSENLIQMYFNQSACLQPSQSHMRLHVSMAGAFQHIDNILLFSNVTHVLTKLHVTV